MNIIVKGSFERDVRKIRNKKLKLAIDEKIIQIENAKDVKKIPGLKKLREYTHFFRVAVNTDTLNYRMGLEIRGNTIWIVRVLPRRNIYKKFP